MVIKIQTADSSHGHNAVKYAMDKNTKKGKKPDVLSTGNLPWDDIFGDSIEPRAVWDYMKMRQKNSGKNIDSPFFHIELCPSKEESANFSKNDWLKLIDDSIKHLGEEFSSKMRGKVKKWDIDNCQWVACLHTDTDKPHIHLILNRITENNEVLDDTQYKDRAKQAANNIALERGWIKAEAKGSKRREEIHKDAINILFAMKKFDLEEYFKQMRLKGWIIDAKYDSKGICRGYSIGEDMKKLSGSKSSTMLIQASKLGFGRDLMVTRLQGTWSKLHPVQAQTVRVEKTSITEPQKQQTASVNEVAKILEVSKPKWLCANYEAREEWNGQSFKARIPKVAYSSIFNAVEEETRGFDKMNYQNPNSEIPEIPDIRAVAIFEFLVAANATVAPGGGGGGSPSNDLRWDGKTKDDFEKMAHGAAKKAFGRCTSRLRKRGLHR